MRFLFFVFLLPFSFNLFAQNTEFTSGLLPSVTFSTTLVDNLALTAKLESMQEVLSNTNSNPDYFNYSYKRTDAQGFISYKLNPFWSVAAGYQYRLTNADENAHRSIQQIAYVQRKTGYRLAHRLRTDQTYPNSEPTEYRFRYRLSAEFALQGQEVDPREFYLLLSDEAIYSLQADDKDIENRLAISVGYYLSSTHRLEAGPDYRIDKILTEGSRHRLWIYFGWKIKI